MITIPSQHYIGVQERDTESSLPLAFATPFGTDAAFEKRKETVDRWCRGYGKYVDGKYVYPEINTKVYDNGLMEGFRIAESIRRIGWNGGNVVWRIVDPRGFELEISSANFARIVDCTTITNGVIQGKCVWGRDGAANVLLPESSEPYMQASANTTRSSQKVDAKSLAVGDEVEFKDGQTWIYLGSYTFLYRKETKNETGQYYNRSRSYTYTIEAKKRHVFGKAIDKEYATARAYYMEQSGAKEGDLRFYVHSDIKKLAAIKRKNALVVDPDSVGAILSAQLEHYANTIESASSDYMSFAAIPGNVKVDDVILSIEPTEARHANFTNLVQRGGVWYAAHNSHNEMQLCSITCDLTQRSYTQANSYAAKIASGDVANTQFYGFVVTYKNKQYRF